MDSINSKLTYGIKWGFVEKFSTYGIQFVLSVIMARILSPSEFGIVGMIGIFIGLSGIFIDSGFAVALIRKKKTTDLELSSVFYFNVLLSFIFYSILFFSAPLIAKFYNIPVLVNITRVLGLGLIINSFSLVQKTKVTIEIKFVIHAKVSILAACFSGIIGILFAYFGYGVWALVIQGTLSTIIATALYWHFSTWRPQWHFSIFSIKSMFGFSSKLMLSSIILVIYNNIYQLVIGKVFSATEVGYYTRANSYANIPNDAIGRSINGVMLPVLSKIQDNGELLLEYYRKFVKTTAYVLFPISGIIATLSEPIIRILITNKWIATAPLLVLLSLAAMLAPIRMMNLNVFHVKGRSDIYLKTEIIHKALITLFLVFTLSHGVVAICMGFLIVSIIQFFINAYYTKMLIGYGAFRQMKDLSIIFLQTSITVIIIFKSIQIVNNDYISLILGAILGTTIILVNLRKEMNLKKHLKKILSNK